MSFSYLKRHKKIISCLCILLIASTMFLGCSDKKENTSSRPVILNEVAHSIFYAPLYVAIENGYFTEQNIDLTLTTGFGADKTMTAVLSNEADIGFMGPEATVYAYNEGANDSIINFAQLTQRAGNFVISRTNDSEFDYEQLKNSTVLGGRAGGMPEMIFEFVLKKHNINPAADLTIDQSIDFGSTAAAFTSGQGDYTIEFEPSATKLETEGVGYVVSSLGIESGFVPYTAFSAKQSYLDEHPDEIRSFIQALKQGMEYVETHSAKEIADVIAPQFPDTDIKELEMIVDRYASQNSWKTDLSFDEDGYTLLLDILEDAGQITERPTYEELVTTAYIKE